MNFIFFIKKFLYLKKKKNELPYTHNKEKGDVYGTKKRKFSKEFKEKVVNLYKSGKSQKEIREEYDLVPSVLAKWIKEYQYSTSSTQTSSTNQKDTLTNTISEAKVAMERDLKSALSKLEKLQKEVQKENDKVTNIKITLDTLNQYLK